MMLTEALAWLLQSDANISALISNRVYPLVTPQTVPAPWIGYQRISDTPRYSHSGNSYLTTTRVQLSVEAASYDQLRRLELLIKAKLGGYKGTINGLTIGSCFVENTIDDYNPTTLHPMVHIDIMVMHDEQ